MSIEEGNERLRQLSFLVRQFDRFNLFLIRQWKILVLVIAERPKASERFNFGTKSSKYRILQIRKVHRRLNFTMQPSSPIVEKQTKQGNADSVRSRSAKSKAGCQTQERLGY